jgi:uncharacterized protein YegJ (DUF2314 family)
VARSWWWLVLVVAVACKGESDPAKDVRPATRSTAPVAEPAAKLEPVPAGSPIAGSARLQFAIYFLPRPRGDARAELVKGLKTLEGVKPPLEVLEKEGTPTAGSHAVVLETPASELSPPTPEELEYFGKGLSPEQAAAVQNSEVVLGCDITAAEPTMHEINRQAMELLLAVARRSGGLIWDESTRQLFTPESWKKMRLDRWTGRLPRAPTLFAIHNYQDGELRRLVTLGLEKMALPNLVVEQVAPSSAERVAMIINLTAQTMLEGGVVQPGGLLALDAATQVDPADPPDQKPGRASITLVAANREEGDPDGRLWEIAFPGGPASQAQERQEALLDVLFPSTDEAVGIEHDEEMMNASKHARETLLGKVKKKFRAGLSVGQHLLVKGPFTTDHGGREWMWVDVISWKGTSIEGLLQNDPDDVSSLKAGARVTVEEGSVFDYMIQRADGSYEGNTTGDIMLRRQKEGR